LAFAYGMDRRSEVLHMRAQQKEADEVVDALQKENRALIERASEAAHRERAAKDELARILLECAERHEERRPPRTLRSGRRGSSGDLTK
jgi:hypothetical protein